MQRHLWVRLNHLTLVAADLRAFLLTQPDPPDRHSFADFAATMRYHYPELDALVYVGPDRIIRDIYPLAGNEQAIGLDLSKRSAAPYIEKAIRERKIIVDPPHILPNGRLAVMARSPVFRNEKFVGLAQTILSVPDAVQNELVDLGSEFAIQLRDESGKLFWGPERIEGLIQSREVVVGDGSWILSVAAQNPPTVNGSILALIWGVGGLVLLFIMWSVRNDYRLRIALKDKVADATRELRLRNEELEQQIRQRLEAEAKVLRSEQSLCEAQQIALLGNWERNLAGNRLYWSDELYRIFGFNPQEFYPTFEAFLARIHPDDRDAIRQGLIAAQGLKAPFEFEYRLLLPGGEVRYVRASGIEECDAEGNLLRTAGTVQDITAQKLAHKALEESERKYRAVMENASDGILIASIEGKVLDGNRRMQTLLGYSRDELLNLYVSEIHPPEEAEKLRIAFISLREHGFSLFEHLLLRKDGTTIPVEVAGTFVTFDNQQVALGLFRDIRERKRIEAELDRHRNQLEHLVEQRTAELMTLNSELESFSYSVSHDLRAPLRAIKGFCAALQEDCTFQPDATCRNYLERIQSASERMGYLIDDLLRLSRTVRAEMNFHVVSLSAVATELLQDFHTLDSERHIHCVVAEGVTVRCDLTLIRSLLQNLLSNAWKFTRSRADAMIEFGVITHADSPIYFVRDNGIGFEMVHAEDLFNPFYRLHTPSEYEGNGIGLTTVQRIVHRHGGRVWAESVPRQGATFYFTLEVLQDDSGTLLGEKTAILQKR
jgi:PAS domain S-box-containing protein